MRSGSPWLEAWLERGALPPPRTRLGGALGAAWGRVLGRAVVRPLAWPDGTRIVAVGGATLGGSGKTPLAIACAAALARAAPRLRVALVGHAYRASPGRARVVRSSDRIEEVGDEAIVAHRALEQIAYDPQGRVPVVVGPTRASAVELAAKIADVLVLDGVVQASPRRASLALLAVDADEPWGYARQVPPWGDLRAPPDRLAGLADRVVVVGDAGKRPPVLDALHARNVGSGARLGDDLLPWETLARLRVGLVCALARPGRVLRLLERRGVHPVVVLRGRDHGPLPPARLGGARVDLWLATPKCALHASHTLLSAPLATLEHRLEPCAGLLAALTGVAAGHTLETSRNHSQKPAGPP